MKPEIVIKDRENSQDNLIILGASGSSFSLPFLNKEEKEYIKHQIANKQKTIRINQYSRMIFVQLLDQKEPAYHTLEGSRIAASRLRDLLEQEKITNITVLHADNKKDELLAFAEGLVLSSYQFLKYQTKAAEKENVLCRICLKHPEIKKADIDEMNIITEAVYKARDLINEPVSSLNAVRLSKEIEKMGKEAGFNVEVFSKTKIEALKMGGLLAVNKGSVDPPSFTVMEWKPSKAKNDKPVVLVGKGIMYDTGGLSLKPTTDSMDYMKSDMSGAAAVISAMYAIARNQLPVYVVGLVPATDNRPSGNAFAPGDVVTMYDKTTVEVLNSDAEGRMILADALAYAKAYKPLLGITIATLTGAAARAIGKIGMVGMGNAPAQYFDLLKESGNRVYERIAEFPFWEEYEEMIKSEVADIQNAGGPEAASITAGKFLEHFTDYPFIHLDIAGPAFIKTADAYRGKGGTGTGVRLLYDFIKSIA